MRKVTWSNMILWGLILVIANQCKAADSNDTTGESHGDKSGYTLFNPTPRLQMREFNSDRPNVTESPFTVDAGHYQIEFSFVEYTYNHDQGVRTDGFSVLPANLKVGLLNNLDLELIVNPYENILIHGNGISNRSSGFGDTQLRTKLNLWGNDEGICAGGVMPFIQFPTGTGGLSDHHIEGGLILPLNIKLPAGFEMGTMAEFDFDRNEDNDGYGVDFLHSITFDHELFDEMDGYVEYVGISPSGTEHTYLAYFDTGVTYAITKEIQLDGGIKIGLSRGTDDFTVFSGLTLRY